MSFFFPVKEDPKPTGGCRRKKDDEVEEEGEEDDDDDDERGRAALCAAEHEDKNISFLLSFLFRMRIFSFSHKQTNKSAQSVVAKR